jgi:outer membrane cobalamin receptor
VQHGLGSWDVGAAVRHSGQRADVDPVSFADAIAPARTTLALTGGWTISPAWRLAARLDNATENQRPEVLGYRPAQRSLGLSLSARL